MIKSNELRVGNLVKYTGGFENKDLTYFITESVEIDAIAENPLYEPIPLTPEILEKAGFELELKFESGDYWFHEKMRTFAASRMYIYLPYSLFDSMAPCKYVHQLQNLYWVLVGEELEISL
jgi:hypothetical protein